MISILLLISQITSKLCSADNQCGKSDSCCSTHGYCGKGHTFCGLDCISEGSYRGDACYPTPGCKSKLYDFKDTNRIISAKNYNGDYKAYDWIISGDYTISKEGKLRIKMEKGKGGNTLSSTRFFNNAKVQARLKTSRSPGVISSFITMSPEKDEIDWEWVGNELMSAQSNYFKKGIKEPPKPLMRHSIVNDTSKNYNIYTIDWGKDKLQWYLDNKVVRTLNANNGSDYPDTDSRMFFGIWDASNQSKGVQEWAGGVVNWDSKDYLEEGYFFVELDWVKIDCYNETVEDDQPLKKDSKGMVVYDNCIFDLI